MVTAHNLEELSLADHMQSVLTSKLLFFSSTIMCKSFKWPVGTAISLIKVGAVIGEFQ